MPIRHAWTVGNIEVEQLPHRITLEVSPGLPIIISEVVQVQSGLGQVIRSMDDQMGRVSLPRRVAPSAGT
jgi:hypothetical protein